MRKADFERNHLEFEYWIGWYGDFLLKLIETKHVVKTKTEKLELVEALVLRCATRWEVLVSADLVAGLNRDPSAYADSVGLRLRKHLSYDESEAIIIGHRYLDFKSVGDSKRFAKKYLVSQYNPFQAITSKMEKRIDEFMTMRNLLAHYSHYAWRSYRKMMTREYSYERVREPGAFLITVNRRTDYYRWSEYLDNFLHCSEKMRETVT